MNILVKYEHYLLYLKENNNSDYLDRENKYRIWTKSKSLILNKFKINEEIFEGTPTEYNIVQSDNVFIITFKTKSNTEYRFDLLEEPNTKIYHLAFSLKDSDEENYEKATDLNESIEVFSKLIWILKDIKINVDEFCIGATGNPKKDKIYEYMMRFVKDWKKRKNNHYPLGWAIYFKI